MVPDLHFKILDAANRELSRRFEKLRKVRASRDTPGIKQAEMEYYHALKHLYTAVQDAVAEGIYNFLQLVASAPICHLPYPLDFSNVFCYTFPKLVDRISTAMHSLCRVLSSPVERCE